MATAGLMTIASSVRFLFPNALFARSEVFAIGRQEEYAIGIDGRWQEEHRIWIVKEPNRMYAMFSECTHLGCNVNWFPREQKFKCPCHGSDFSTDGTNVRGPAPRPLDRARIMRTEEGQILVDKTRKFRWEQRDQSEAYLAI